MAGSARTDHFFEIDTEASLDCFERARGGHACQSSWAAIAKIANATTTSRLDALVVQLSGVHVLLRTHKLDRGAVVSVPSPRGGIRGRAHSPYDGHVTATRSIVRKVRAFAHEYHVPRVVFYGLLPPEAGTVFLDPPKHCLLYTSDAADE